MVKLYQSDLYKADTFINRTLFSGPNRVRFRGIPLYTPIVRFYWCKCDFINKRRIPNHCYHISTFLQQYLFFMMNKIYVTFKTKIIKPCSSGIIFFQPLTVFYISIDSTNYIWNIFDDPYVNNNAETRNKSVQCTPGIQTLRLRFENESPDTIKCTFKTAIP